jgi:NAD+ synthase
MPRESQDVGSIKETAQSKNMTMTPKQRITTIVKWIRAYARSAKIRTLVVGISGGIDSSVVSALCARTGLKTIIVQMPIRQNKTLDNRSSMQASWLLERHADTVTHMSMDLTPVFAAFEKKVDPYCNIEDDTYQTYQLASANSRARLRMMTLYQIAQCNGGIVVGTGNRVEDFGVGFFTKYGDGGVDISPIGDCLKTDVWDMGRELGLPQEIIDAAPTDGLWMDGRTDEDQLGMTYPELELAMDQDENSDLWTPTTAQEKKNLRRYREIRATNLHKMLPIPVCKFDW